MGVFVAFAGGVTLAPPNENPPAVVVDVSGAILFFLSELPVVPKPPNKEDAAAVVVVDGAADTGALIKKFLLWA